MLGIKKKIIITSQGGKPAKRCPWHLSGMGASSPLGALILEESLVSLISFKHPLCKERILPDQPTSEPGLGEVEMWTHQEKGVLGRQKGPCKSS